MCNFVTKNCILQIISTPECAERDVKGDGHQHVVERDEIEVRFVQSIDILKGGLLHVHYVLVLELNEEENIRSRYND